MFHDAGRTYDSKHGDNLVDEFQKLFLKHKVEFALSLMLNHRHFDLHLDERLIEYRGTSVPWLTNHDKAQPSVWFVSEDNSCHPYEFHYSPDAATDGAATMPGDPEYKEFIKAFAQLLLEKNVEGLFGLCRYPGDDLEGRVEITEGRANINLHPDEAPQFLVARNASWFPTPVMLGKCVCICGGGGHTTASHKGHVPKR